MATNWQKAVSQEDFNELNAKVGNSTDDETKVTLFGKLAKVFQSVSSGKSKIATAITGKGIATLGSDTFAKMAGNIDLIKMVASGDAGKILAGQSINGINGTATNDANALAGDMLSGKSGYVKGLKVAGIMANNGAAGMAIANGALKQGYTTGGDIANLLAGNVKKGVNIGGVVGDLSSRIIYGNATEHYSGNVQYSPTKPFIFTASEPIIYAMCSWEPITLQIIVGVFASYDKRYDYRDFTIPANGGSIRFVFSNGNKTITATPTFTGGLAMYLHY